MSEVDSKQIRDYLNRNFYAKSEMLWWGQEGKKADFIRALELEDEEKEGSEE